MSALTAPTLLGTASYLELVRDNSRRSTRVNAGTRHGAQCSARPTMDVFGGQIEDKRRGARVGGSVERGVKKAEAAWKAEEVA